MNTDEQAKKEWWQGPARHADEPCHRNHQPHHRDTSPNREADRVEEGEGNLPLYDNKSLARCQYERCFDFLPDCP